MTAPCADLVKRVSVEDLYRRHIREMRAYATQLEVALGADSPIVKRILSCASSNEDALNRVTKRKCEACGQDAPQ